MGTQTSVGAEELVINFFSEYTLKLEPIGFPKMLDVACVGEESRVTTGLLD